MMSAKTKTKNTPMTAAAAERYQPRGERREIRDHGTLGLYLVIQKGGTRSWALRFRKPNGQSAKLTLGPLDRSGKELEGQPHIGMPLTLHAARQLAAEIHRNRARGRDVIADFKADRHRKSVAIETAAENSFGKLVRKFIDEHARRKTRRWRETARYLGLAYPADGGEPVVMKDGVAARWLDRPATEVDGHDIYSLIDETKRHGVPGVKTRLSGLSDARGRAMARAASKLFSWLLQHRKIAVNPCVGMYVPPAPQARDRVLTADEVRWFWRGCDAIGEPFGQLFKLLLLTGARREEVAAMTDSELTDASTWRLAGSRTKNRLSHVVPLAPLACDVLASVKRRKNDAGYVFTTNGASSVSGFSKVKERLDEKMLAAARKEAEVAGGDPAKVTIAPWRLHDLRRTCATFMIEKCGVAPHVVELALNHVSGHKAGVAGTYNRAQLMPERRAALDRWAAHVEGIVTEKPLNVVSLPRKPSR